MQMNIRSAVLLGIPQELHEVRDAHMHGRSGTAPYL